MLATIKSDLHFAMRMLRKSPIFTIVAVLCISLGSGAVTTIFSAMNALVLRPLPGTTETDRLVVIERRTPNFRQGTSASYAYYTHLRDRSRTLEGIAAWSRVALSIAAAGDASAVSGNIVSGNYFEVLGVRPSLGRFFLPEEDRTPLANPVIVVSHAFWVSRLGSDTAVVGQTVGVNGHRYTIVGVAPAGFRGVFTALKVDAWVPLMMQGQLRPGRDLENAPWLWVFGRLRREVSSETARPELVALTGAWIEEAVEPPQLRSYTGVRLSKMTGLPDDARGAFLGFMGLLLGAAVLVLLIASVNVASMLSARAVARRREMAVRAALGAARARLIGQLLTESLLLFLIGAFGGLLVAWFATAAFERVPIPGDAGISLELSPDPRVLGFALFISLAVGVVFGLAPALQGTREDITSRLRDSSAAGGTRRSRLGNALIVGQLALSLVLLVAAGLFVRALNFGAQVDPGFEVAGVATAPFKTESWGYDEAKARRFYDALREQLRAVPGVTAVSYTGIVPLARSSSGGNIEVAGADDRPAQASVQIATVDVDYFATVRMPLIRGRAFVSTDDARSVRVAVINETLARRLWPDGSAIGRTFGHRGNRVTVVGIARDAKYASLDEQTPPFVYFAMAQTWRSDQTLLVRTSADPSALGPVIQSAVRTLDPALPRPAVSTLQRETSIVLLPQRVAAIVTGVLGGVGLLLATVGLYGVIAYSVSRRSRELGVRLALGARRADVVNLIVRDGMRLAGLGVLVGLVLAVVATRLIAGFLFSVSPMDGMTYAGMSVLFVVIALFASYLPARRASRSDPMVALRSD